MLVEPPLERGEEPVAASRVALGEQRRGVVASLAATIASSSARRCLPAAVSEMRTMRRSCVSRVRTISPSASSRSRWWVSVEPVTSTRPASSRWESSGSSPTDLSTTHCGIEAPAARIASSSRSRIARYVRYSWRPRRSIEIESYDIERIRGNGRHG